MSRRVVLLVTTPRTAPGLLSWSAWAVLRSGRVFAGSADHPHRPALTAAGIEVETLTGSTTAIAARLRERASGQPAVWLATDDDRVGPAVATLAAREPDVVVEVLPGAWDLPGARLLDVVAVIDRLRSPGGCPWDAEQTHTSLGPYLLEEAYEAYAAIENGDLDALREELGDVLVQVALHARLAEDGPEDARWSIDDVAGDLVAKLVRRHPHVFATTEAPTAAHVKSNWEQIKTAEKGRTSITQGVPLGQPALALAAKLQQRAARAGLPTTLHAQGGETLPAEVAAAAARVEESPDPVETVGELLFTAVALARAHEVDAEAALRGAARRYIDLVVERESASRD